MRRKIIFLSLLLPALLPAAAQAQQIDRQVIAAVGGSGNAGGIQADYTAGESLTSTLSGSGLMLTQGFHQPEGTGDVHVPGVRPVSIRFSLYPSPADNYIHLQANAAAPEEIRLSVTAATGAVVYRQAQAASAYPEYSGAIPVAAYAAGVYFLNIYNHAGTLMESIRFIKK